MAPDETTTLASVSDDASITTSTWYLVVAFSSADPRAMPRRIALQRTRSIDLGRGEETVWRREEGGRALKVTVADRSASQQHARLTLDRDGWKVTDLGSKNGTRKNGERIEEAPLADGDVIECGGMFLVLRDAPRGVEVTDLQHPVGPHPLLRSISASYLHDVELLARVARTAVPILLSGDTGTGKEVAARAAHEISGRSGRFQAINCGGLAPTLVASELFGVRKGAFSGAEQDRPGLVRAAHGGTLFLDEIGELGLDNQAALLRVLQEHEVTPVGETRPVKVDLRVIAATGKPLEEMAAAGKFRRDLLARLRGFELRLPTLRARIEDLGLLIGTLLERIEPERQRSFSRSAARTLFRHRWPLHIRELEQALRAAVAVAGDNELGRDDLPESIRSEPADVTARAAEAVSSEPVTRERFGELVAEHAGNVSNLARALGTSRSQVRRLADRWVIDLADARKR